MENTMANPKRDRKGRKKWIIGLLIAAAVLMLGIGLCDSCISRDVYAAERQCRRVLFFCGDGMERTARNVLENKTVHADHFTGKYMGYDWSCYPDSGVVCFGIGSQGMLGGQYWDLVYSADGTLFGSEDVYVYTEPEGNNIIKALRLRDNWWFRWTDYDGTKMSGTEGAY